MIFGVDLVFNLSQLIRQYVNPKRAEMGLLGALSPLAGYEVIMEGQRIGL